MNKEEIIKQLYNLPKYEECKAVSEFTSLSIEDIENVIDKMNENKTYYEVVRENKQLKEEIKTYQDMYFDKLVIINKAIEYINAIQPIYESYGKTLFQKVINELLEILKDTNDAIEKGDDAIE